MKRIFPTILFLFIMITLFTIPTIQPKNTLRTNLELEKQLYPNQFIYLKNKDNYYVKVEVILPNNKEIEDRIDYLKVENKERGNEWSGYIPNDVKIREYKINNNTLEIHFSEELKTLTKEELSALYYSLKEIKNIEDVNIYIENEIVDQTYSINLEDNIINRNNIEKVVVYYLDDNKYYVPVTKYIDNNDKINSIINNLKNNIPNNLMSYVSNKLQLISYEEENDTIILHFNENLKEDTEGFAKEEIAYSIMDNYDVSTVLFYIDKKYEKMVTKKA